MYRGGGGSTGLGKIPKKKQFFWWLRWIKILSKRICTVARHYSRGCSFFRPRSDSCAGGHNGSFKYSNQSMIFGGSALLFNCLYERNRVTRVTRVTGVNRMARVRYLSSYLKHKYHTININVYIAFCQQKFFLSFLYGRGKGGRERGPLSQTWTNILSSMGIIIALCCFLCRKLSIGKFKL